MSEPLYVPVLRARQSDAAAYRTLTPDVRCRVAPLWTLPPRLKAVGREREERIRKDIAHVTGLRCRHPAWLDAMFPDQFAAPYPELLRQCWLLTQLRPVTGPERPRAQQELAIEAARESGKSLGVRVRLPGEWREGLADDSKRLAETAAPHVRLELLLDVGAVLGSRPDAGKEALRALDTLVALTGWLSASVIAAGCPGTSSRELRGERCETDRYDWELWHEVLNSGRDYAPSLRYGDYTTLPAGGIATDPDNDGPAPVAYLRYTTERTFAFARFSTRAGSDRARAVRAAAGWLTGLDDYRGPTAGSGDRWLHDCAHPSPSGAAPARGTKAPNGTGNQATWSQVASNQHMTYAVRQLMSGQ